MAELNFTGEIDTLSEHQINLVRDVFKNQGFKDETVTVQNVGKKEDKYLNAVKRIIVQTNDKTFQVIAKIAPKTEMTRLLMNTNILYTNEMTMYNEVLPKFLEYMERETLPETERIKMAKCYGSLAEAPNEIILLEDMCVSNFEMLDRLAPLSDEYVKLALKDLAIYHSLSYVMRERDPDIFEGIINKLPNLWAVFDAIENIKIWLQQLEDDVISVISDEKYGRLIKGVVTNLTNIAKTMHKINMRSKHSVIAHGDCWTNNILFRLLNGSPVESCLIDYQLSKPANPVEDIHYITFICTNYSNRSKHFNEWIDHYHTELDKSLTNYGLKANRIYPRDQLDADLRRHGKLIVATSINMANVLSREFEETLDLKDNNIGESVEDLMKKGEAFRIINVKEETKDHFRRRIRDCIDSALELGYI